MPVCAQSGGGFDGLEDSEGAPGSVSPAMRQLLPLLMQQLQNNPDLLKQFGVGGAAGLNGAGIPGLAAPPVPGVTSPGVPGVTVPQAIPEQVQIYRQQYHPVDIDVDGKISADEAASYAAWMFRRRDINGDGVLVIREFSAVEQLPGTAEANRQRLRTESRRLELLFATLDTNGDKMISKDEFMAHAAQNFDEKRGNDPDITPFAFQTVLPF
ncbi:MAG: EF-hand domain-containing protein [Pseudomonadota bacterium]